MAAIGADDASHWVAALNLKMLHSQNVVRQIAHTEDAPGGGR